MAYLYGLVPHQSKTISKLLKILCKMQTALSKIRSRNTLSIFYHYYNILTSDPAELTNKKSTGVNNRCIRSKISGDNLDYVRVELSADATLTEAGGCQTII